jgi:hypothetical protein
MENLLNIIDFEPQVNAIFFKKHFTSANDNDYYCHAFRGDPYGDILKARHCSHCFQYYFSQPGAGFFFALLI